MKFVKDVFGINKLYMLVKRTNVNWFKLRRYENEETITYNRENKI